MPGTGEPTGRPAANASRWQPEAFQADTNARSLPADATKRSRPSVLVLADRIASALVHHEPGWRLPRQSAMARRYNASTAEIDAALEELVGRHLIRRLPDGQLYRASPADYLIRLDGMPGLASHIDPMGAVITCRSFHVSLRRAPEEIAQALGIGPSPVCVARLMWTANGQPAALATTYLTSRPPGLAIGAQPTSPTTALTVVPHVLAGPSGQEESADAMGAFRTHALCVEMLPPPPSIARTLRMSAGAPATLITVRFDDPSNGTPTALTMVVLRPDLFRIAINWSEGPEDAPASWAPALRDAEP